MAFLVLSHELFGFDELGNVSPLFRRFTSIGEKSQLERAKEKIVCWLNFWRTCCFGFHSKREMLEFSISLPWITEICHFGHLFPLTEHQKDWVWRMCLSKVKAVYSSDSTAPCVIFSLPSHLISCWDASYLCCVHKIIDLTFLAAVTAAGLSDGNCVIFCP